MKIDAGKELVVVQLDTEEEVLASGVVVPITADQDYTRATVVSCGPIDVGMDLKVGDRVMMRKDGGATVRVGEEQYYVVRHTSILCKVSA